MKGTANGERLKEEEEEDDMVVMMVVMVVVVVVMMGKFALVSLSLSLSRSCNVKTY
jgi:hypothetical protein